MRNEAFEASAYYDPQKAAARRLLQAIGADGSVPIERVPRGRVVPAAIPQPANDNVPQKRKTEPVRNPTRGSPTRERLVRTGDADGLLWLRRFMELSEPNCDRGYPDQFEGAEEMPEIPELPNIDRHIEVRPSIPEIAFALDGSTDALKGKNPSLDGERELARSKVGNTKITRLAGLRFRDGPQDEHLPPLHSYRTARGWNAPGEKLRRPRGALVAANDNRPDPIAAHFEYEAEIERRDLRDKIRARIPEYWQILEGSVGDMTAREAGEISGKQGRYAIAAGMKRIATAIESFKKIYAEYA